MKKYVGTVCLAVMLIISACSNEGHNVEEIKAFVERNLTLAENEDLEGYMATISKDSPHYAETEKLMKQIFAEFDLSYTLESVEVLEKDGDEVKVEVTHVTKLVSGEKPFRDNRMTTEQTLVLEGDSYTIISSKITDYEDLD